MRALKITITLATLGCASLCWAAASRPNVLFILTDDQGWPTLGCYGNKQVPTPHLDALARDGMRFTAAYVMPQCTPTRAALLTGQHTARNQLWHVIGNHYHYPHARVKEPVYADNLPRETFTVAKGLRAAGYRTGIIGKWHLNTSTDGNYLGLRPEAAAYYGFEVSVPTLGNENANGDKGVNRFTEEAIKFITARRDRPWFLYLAYHTIHGPVLAPDELVKKYRDKGAPAEGLHNATYLAAIEHLDTAVGRLLGALDNLHLRERTLVVFLSDNGGVYQIYAAEPFTKGPGSATQLAVEREEFSNAPLRAGKGSHYEGGIRVPCMVRWPGVVPAGRVNDTPIHVVDWLPTLLEAAGASAPKQHVTDGVSLLPLLRGGQFPSRPLFWYLPLYEVRWGGTPCAIIREGDWKLIEFFGDWFDAQGRYVPGAHLELYNLRTDLGETRNLAEAESARAAALHERIHAWMKGIPAEIPGPNPDFDERRQLLETNAAQTRKAGSMKQMTTRHACRSTPALRFSFDMRPHPITHLLFFGAALSFAIAVGCQAHAATEVTVWDGPGGDVAASPDYEVTVRSGDKTWRPFTYYSYNRPVDKLLDREGKYLKLSFLALHSNEYKRPENNRDTYAHSWTHFDFAGGPVEIEVKIKRPLDGLTLPLKSCAILPSTLGIKGQVVGSDTIRFTLNNPAKIAVVPNHLEALEKLKTADPKQAFEGYRNPLFLFARLPETDIPDKNAPGTLMIKPGQACGVEDFAKARVIYFEPGLHDYSQFNPADPEHYITLHTGQTMYLAGGAYVHGVVNFDKRGPVSEMPLLRGRGTLSGIKQRWTDLPYRTTLERNVRMEGIQIADPHNHISHSYSPVKDVAVVGAWHGNTDGLTREVPKSETYQGWHLDDCFVMAADSNLKVGGPARVRNYTAWQLNNAEPFWIRDPDGCTVDGVQIIAYHNPAGRQTINISRGAVRNSVFRNIVVEAPFVPLLFLMPVSGGRGGPVYENVRFENVTVNTPNIARKSPFGAAEEGVQIGKVVFRNLVINGVKVTGQNCRDYFDLLKGVTIGKEMVFE